jgi:lysophospholipid acyltransferase (LPLAT)-like uncharacterized protein
MRPLWASARPAIYAIWHGQILMVPFVTERLGRSRGTRAIHVMASRSRDGELLARVVRRFGFGAVRGSSSRAGARALRLLARRVRAGHDVAITPDGPRGPAGQAQPGVVVLADLTRAPIVPVAFAACPVWRLPSWDDFEIPGPFARGAIVFGPPLHFEGTGDRTILLKDLQAALDEATDRARRAVRPD